MNSTYLNNKPKDFWPGKRVILKSTLTNLGGDSIIAGTEVTVVQRNTDKISLDIKSDSGVCMNGVWCEHFELVTNQGQNHE